MHVNHFNKDGTVMYVWKLRIIDAEREAVQVKATEIRKDTTKKLPELTNEFSKAARQKHTELYFSTLTMNFQNENLRIPFTTASKRVRYLAINPRKEIEAITQKTVRQ